jgi:hypothetical protein
MNARLVMTRIGLIDVECDVKVKGDNEIANVKVESGDNSRRFTRRSK